MIFSYLNPLLSDDLFLKRYFSSKPLYSHYNSWLVCPQINEQIHRGLDYLFFFNFSSLLQWDLIPTQNNIWKIENQQRDNSWALLEIHCYSISAAAAKSLQSCLTLCDPIDGSPPGSPVPGILQARTLEWVAIFFSNAWKWKVKVKSLSRVRPLAIPWTVAYQAPLSMGFSRQEYWNGLPLFYL